MTDSNAILKYLAESRKEVPKTWYPKDIIKRAEIDEVLDWCQCHFRQNFNMGYRHATHIPMEAEMNYVAGFVKLNCDTLETIITRSKGGFICGSNPTIADLQVFFTY